MPSVLVWQARWALVFWKSYPSYASTYCIHARLACHRRKISYILQNKKQSNIREVTFESDVQSNVPSNVHFCAATAAYSQNELIRDTME
jgi:hypothetical protein